MKTQLPNSHYFFSTQQHQMTIQKRKNEKEGGQANFEGNPQLCFNIQPKKCNTLTSRDLNSIFDVSLENLVA